MAHTVSKENGKVLVSNQDLKGKKDKYKGKLWKQLSAEEKADYLALRMYGITDDTKVEK